MTTEWIVIGMIGDIPRQGARTLTVRGEPVAIFRTFDDRVFALLDRCPHRQGPLSQGIVHGHAVTCPLHNWNIDLETGEALGEDSGRVPPRQVRIEDGRVLIACPQDAHLPAA